MSVSNTKNLIGLLAFGIGFASAGSHVAAATPPAAAPAAKAAPAAVPPAAKTVPAAASPTAPGDPVAIIRKKDAELQKLLRDKSAKTDRLKALINGIFDFEELGKKALGPDQWKKMSADRQKRFVKAFREMVENSSVKKLEAYQSDSTAYDPVELRDGAGPSGRTASVTSHVFSKGQESIVTYKLFIKDGEWKAWDLVIDDLSTAGNYGDQFRKILQTSDIEGLIARLEKKASGADGKPTDSVKAKSEKAASSQPSAQDAAKKAPVAAPAKPTPAGSTTPAPKTTPPSGAQGAASPGTQGTGPAKPAPAPAATSAARPAPAKPASAKADSAQAKSASAASNP